MKSLLLTLAMGFMLVSCGSEKSSEPTIGPQFWKYDLSEFESVDHDVKHGLGGRWISQRLNRRPGMNLTRKDLVNRITAALKADGWAQDTKRIGGAMISKTWETSENDLYFSRPAKPGEPEYWFFEQQIYVSTDASVVCLYADVGW